MDVTAQHGAGTQKWSRPGSSDGSLQNIPEMMDTQVLPT